MPRDLVDQIVFKAAMETDARLYPLPELENELMEKIAERYSVDPEMVVITNGADDAIALLLDAVRLFSKESRPLVATLKPSYPMYSLLSKAKGCEVDIIKMNENDFRVDKELALEKSSKADIVFFCNPNNPTGNLLDLEILKSVAESSRGLFVVDETYLLFAEGAKSLAGSYENTVVIGTFSKAFGLAGLRLGYIVARSEIAEFLRVLRTPYQVNSIALRAGLLALSNIHEFEKYIAEARELRHVLASELRELNDLEVYDTQTNFVFAKTKIRASTLSRELRKRGVCVRVYENLFREGDSYVRVSVPPRRLLSFVKEVFYDVLRAS
ncbi:MAG: histidinol-phosphate transaminase [Acidilobaceae archaeon]